MSQELYDKAVRLFGHRIDNMLITDEELERDEKLIAEGEIFTTAHTSNINRCETISREEYMQEFTDFCEHVNGGE